MMKIRIGAILAIASALLVVSPSHAWHDHTHLAVAKAAGYPNWYNAAAADITKTKARDIEEKNHYYNNYANETVADRLVLDQVKLYNSPSNEEGHLYGAIIASLREYRKKLSANKYAEYPMAFAVHYVGDLSQPLHNVRHDQFNKARHSANDGIVNDDILDKLQEIEKRMYEIDLRSDDFEGGLAKEIARIANLTRQLAFRMKSENRNMTREEAYIQLGHSASLLKAVLNATSDDTGGRKRRSPD